MSTAEIAIQAPQARPQSLGPLATLARRRFQLTARTPRAIAVAVARGIDFHATGTGILWFVAAAALFTVGMYGIAEILANRVPRQEEYIARVPAIAILPWFLAGALFPIAALPSFLTWVAKFLPLTHGLALMRYGLSGDGTGLHAIWGLTDPTAMAALSLAVVGGFALLLTAASIRVFRRSAVR